MGFNSFIDILKNLVRQPSVVGSEHSFFRALQRELEERGAKVAWYEGVLVAQGSDPKSAMFSAHIDRHGLICTGPNEFQYAAFIAANRTDLLGTSVSESMMDKVTDRYFGLPVYAYEPWSGAYLGAGTISHAFVCKHRHNLIFELEGLEHVLAGTPVAFKDKLSIVNGRLEAQLDNCLTAAALVHLFEEGFQGTAFFTAEEEAGKSWRYLLEWYLRFGQPHNQLFVLDTSPFPNVEVANKQQVVLRKKDVNASFNPKQTAALEQLCLEQDISFIYKDSYVEALNEELLERGEKPQSIGSTELGRIIVSSGGYVDGTTIQVPTIGYHTMQESAARDSVEAFLRLLQAIARSPDRFASAPK